MKKLLFMILVLLFTILCGCASSSSYVKEKLNQREADRIEHEQYSNETKGSNVWWNSKYDSRTTNRHLSNDHFGGM